MAPTDFNKKLPPPHLMRELSPLELDIVFSAPPPGRGSTLSDVRRILDGSRSLPPISTLLRNGLGEVCLQGSGIVFSDASRGWSKGFQWLLNPNGGFDPHGVVGRGVHIPDHSDTTIAATEDYPNRATFGNCVRNTLAFADQFVMGSIPHQKLTTLALMLPLLLLRTNYSM